MMMMNESREGANSKSASTFANCTSGTIRGPNISTSPTDGINIKMTAVERDAVPAIPTWIQVAAASFASAIYPGLAAMWNEGMASIAE